MLHPACLPVAASRDGCRYALEGKDSQVGGEDWMTGTECGPPCALELSKVSPVGRSLGVAPVPKLQGSSVE